jgi:hydroxyacylglutathione hydrolase
MTEIHVIPTLEDNYSYVIAEGEKAMVVDCGEAAPVLAFLREKRLTAETTLLTHHHGDHVAGIGGLRNAFPGMTVLAPARDMDRIDGVDEGLRDGDTFVFAGHAIEALATPGHTRNHLCYHAPSLAALFSGDTLFSMGCGRLFEGTPEDMFASLQRLKRLPDATSVYAGHEYTLKNAEFALSVMPDDTKLRARAEEVAALRAKKLPSLPVALCREKETNLFLRATDAGAFAELRARRDRF